MGGIPDSETFDARLFAQAAQIFNHSNTEFTEFEIFFNENLFSPRPPPPRR